MELRISDSEWLPIMASSSLNLFLLFVYWALGIGYIKHSNIQENKVVRVLSKVGFGGNIVLFICCILILGIGILIGGILGMVGIMLTTALEGDGFGGQGLTNCIIWTGMMPYFLIFSLLAILGLIIAFKEAFNNN